MTLSAKSGWSTVLQLDLALCNVSISLESTAQLQENLIRTPQAQLIPFLKMQSCDYVNSVNSLVKAILVSVSLLSALELLNKGVVPYIWKKALWELLVICPAGSHGSAYTGLGRAYYPSLWTSFGQGRYREELL